MRIQYKIAEQIGDNGFFGDITIEASIAEQKHDTSIEMHEPNSEWEIGIRFGVEVFLRYCINIKGINLKVISLKTNPVDTSQIIVSFIVIKALNEIFRQMKTEPYFDKTLSLFCFPK